MRRAEAESKQGSGPSAAVSIIKYAAAKMNQERTELLVEALGLRGLGWEGEGFSDEELAALIAKAPRHYTDFATNARRIARDRQIKDAIAKLAESADAVKKAAIKTAGAVTKAVTQTTDTVTKAVMKPAGKIVGHARILVGHARHIAGSIARRAIAMLNK